VQVRDLIARRRSGLLIFAAVCKSGQTPSRASVLAAIRKTNEPTSILGQPIRFDSHGDSAHRKFFLYKINSAGNYQLIPG
jgi:ABC-type branched-subunit amino acid transport system substrate-binding protein